MDFESLERSVVWIDAGELDRFAEIVPSGATQEAGAAGNTRLDSDSVTWFEVLHIWPALENDSSSFVAKDAVAFEDQRSDTTRLPKVNIRPVSYERISFGSAENLPAYSSGFYVQKDLSRTWLFDWRLIQRDLMVRCGLQCGIAIARKIRDIFDGRIIPGESNCVALWQKNIVCRHSGKRHVVCWSTVQGQAPRKDTAKEGHREIVP